MSAPMYKDGGGNKKKYIYKYEKKDYFIYICIHTHPKAITKTPKTGVNYFWNKNKKVARSIVGIPASL